MGDGMSESLTIIAENPYNSIYVYEVNIPRDIWNGMEPFLRFDFEQVRAGDHIYIQSISIKHPFFTERGIDNGVIAHHAFNFNNSHLSLDESGLLVLHVVAMDPFFFLSQDLFVAQGAVETVFIGWLIGIMFVWALVAFLVPHRFYCMLLDKVMGFVTVFKELTLVDAIVLSVGAVALILFYSEITLEFRSSIDWNVPLGRQLLVWIAMFLFYHIYKNKFEPMVYEEDNTPVKRQWIPYVILFILSLIVYVPGLFSSLFFFYNDEHQVVLSALGYLDTGRFVFVDDHSIENTRAWPHTLLLAYVIRIFGVSTIATRSVSVAFGVFFILSTFFVINKLVRKTNIAFISSILLLFNFQLIIIFTTVRMYALMLPFSLWLFYCVYQTLHCEMLPKTNVLMFKFINSSVVKKYLNFHFGYLAVTLGLLWLNYVIMPNAIILLLGVMIYIFWTALVDKQQKYITLSLIMVGFAILILFSIIAILAFDVHIPFLSARIARVMHHASFFQTINIVYFWININIPFHAFVGMVLLTIGFVVCLHSRKKVPLLSMATCSYFCTLLFFMFLADRYPAYRYFSFVMPVTVMILSVGYYELYCRLRKSTQYICMTIFCAMIFSYILNAYDFQSVIHGQSNSRTLYIRPVQVLENDAYERGIIDVSLHMRQTNRVTLFPYELNMLTKIIHERDGNHMDILLNTKSQSIGYILHERGEWNTVSQFFRSFLSYELNNVVSAENIVHRYHFITPYWQGIIPYDPDEEILHFTDVVWSDDVAYVHCILRFAPKLDNTAVFVSIEVKEMGNTQFAIHRFQVLIPENLTEGSSIRFILPIHPGTEEASEDLEFTLRNRLYIFRGNNQADNFCIVDHTFIEP